MINAGITGGETLPAGELIRILVNHPDVNILGVTSSVAAGRSVTQVHRGLEGDTALTFDYSFPDSILSKLNVIFLCGEPWEAEKFVESLPGKRTDSEEPLRIIDLTGRYRSEGMVYGLPEDNRKALVRGATDAAIPSAGAMAIELALFPFVKNAMLLGDINATLQMPSTENFVRESQSQSISPDISTRPDPVAPAQYRADAEAIASEVKRWLSRILPSFKGAINLRLTRSEEQRGMKAWLEVPAVMAVADIRRAFDEAYSDHAFTYRVDHEPDVNEVANTNKCLILVDTPSSQESPRQAVSVISVIDNLLKGGAGSAVHCMNLLFGLSERTGLALKASAF